MRLLILLALIALPAFAAEKPIKPTQEELATLAEMRKLCAEGCAVIKESDLAKIAQLLSMCTGTRVDTK